MQLRSYQQEIAAKAVQILKEFGLVCLAMEVRTGKTFTALSAADSYGAKNVLFVTKLKAISSIQSDFDALKPDFNMLVVNFESLHKVTFQYDFFIIDECHKISAFPKANKVQQQLKALIQDKPVILMSGTFTPESFSQYYHILSVSKNSPFKAYGNFYKWAKDFVTLKHKFMYGRQINDYSEAKEVGIRKQTDHLFISYTQKQSGFEQEVTERIFEVAMKPITYRIANLLKVDRIVKGETGEIVADTEVKLLNKLHQVYSGTVKLENGKAIILDDTKARFIFNNWFDRCKKLAIFYKFIEEGNLLRDTFPCHTDNAEDFNSDCTGEMVYIGQIQSSREGVNLSTADYLIMYNIDYSAVSFWQARARMQSKDRVKPALVFWLFATGSIERRIYDAVTKKKNFTLSHFKNYAGIRKQVTV